MDHSWLWEVKYLIYQIQWFIITAKLIYRHGLRIHEYMTGTSWMNKTRVNTPVELHAIQLQTTTASMLLKSLGLLLRQIFNNRSSLFQNTWNHASWNILEIHTRSDHSWTAPWLRSTYPIFSLFGLFFQPEQCFSASFSQDSASQGPHRQLHKKTWIQLLNWQAHQLTGSTFTEYLVMLGSTLFPWLAAWGRGEKVIAKTK